MEGQGDHGKEESCGHVFLASATSTVNKKLDERLSWFAGRRLSKAFSYLILGACHEKVYEAGVIAGQAVPIAIDIDLHDRRQGLGIEVANRESRSSWRDFILKPALGSGLMASS